MNKPKQVERLINLAGAAVGLFVIGYVAYAALNKEAEAVCSARYPAPIRFSLQTSEGKPLSAIALQARAGLRELGVVDNAAVVPVEGAAWGEALEIKLRRLPKGADPDARTRSGIAFDWGPPGMAKAGATCLSYSVWLPDGFAFGDGGFLPGVFGSAASGKSPVGSRFSVSPYWDNSGRPMLQAVQPDGTILLVSGPTASLASNRWVRIEQEVVLNAPGAENGSVKLWIDGKLVLEDGRARLRSDEAATLSGVLVAAGYKSVPANPGTLMLSPLEISWR